MSTFSKHGTFYIRNGWLRKGMIALQNDETIFSPSNLESAIDYLGIGNVMVSSLRYWLVVSGLVEESKRNNSICLDYTDLGKIIMEHDPYFEMKSTWWLIHYNIASSSEDATTWYWFFNKFNYDVFDEELFVSELRNYIKYNIQKDISDDVIKKDYLCLKNSYLFQRNISSHENNEDIISSPLRELKLISNNDKTRKIKINKIPVSDIDEEIIMYVILERIADGQNQISLDELLSVDNQVGKIFKIDNNVLVYFLERLEAKKYITFFRRFSGSYIELHKLRKNGRFSFLEKYYESHMG